MCELNPKHTKILRLEFFTSQDVSEEAFLQNVAEKALQMEMLANADGTIRCHVHEMPS